MAQYSTDFDEFTPGAITSPLSVQAAGAGDWTQTIVDLGSGDHAARIVRSGASQGASVNIIIGALSSSGDAEVYAEFSLSGWATNFFAGGALVDTSNNWIYGFYRSGTNTYALGEARGGSNWDTLGTTSTSFDQPTTSDTVCVRIRRTNSASTPTIEGKIWLKGESEPDWQISRADASLGTLAPGMYGHTHTNEPYTFTAFGAGTNGDSAPAPSAGPADPTITDVDTDEVVTEGQTSVAVTLTDGDAAGGRTFHLVQGSVEVAQTETGTPTDTAAELTIGIEGTTADIKYGDATLRVTRTADDATGEIAVTVNPPSSEQYVDLTGFEADGGLDAIPDLEAGDQVHYRAVGGGQVTGLTIDTSGRVIWDEGATVVTFEARAWDVNDATWDDFGTISDSVGGGVTIPVFMHHRRILGMS